MRVFPLALVIPLLPACSGDREDAAWWDNERTLVELQGEINLARYQLDVLTPGPPPATADPVSEDLAAEIALLTARKARLSGELRELQDGWDGFRRTVLERRRTEVIGTKLASFTTKRGRFYENVTISRIGDGGVSFQHSNGTARLRFDGLKTRHQEFFGLDEELSSIALEAENEKRLARQRRIEKSLAAAKMEEAELAGIRKKEEDERDAVAKRTFAEKRRAGTSDLLSSMGKLGDTRMISTGRRGSTYRRRPTHHHYYYNSPRPVRNTCTDQARFWVKPMILSAKSR